LSAQIDLIELAVQDIKRPVEVMKSLGFGQGDWQLKG